MGERGLRMQSKGFMPDKIKRKGERIIKERVELAPHRESYYLLIRELHQKDEGIHFWE